MAVENCDLCKVEGMCERPLVPGEPKVRIVVFNNGTQGIEREPIEFCPRRIEINEEIAGIIQILNS